MTEQAMIETLKSKAEIDSLFQEICYSSGYKRLFKFFGFGLRARFGLGVDSQLFFKTILFIIPIWYMGYEFETAKNTSDKNRINLIYYTKGLKFLDIFGVCKKWNREIVKIQSILC